MTISKAYNLLERDDVLERRPGKPLVVRALDPEELEVEKIDRLRASLTDAVRAARQLGLENEEALRVYGELLEDASEEERS
jgi:DNA-binding transcriptional regulator YhcF (GntR family)